VRPEGLDKEKIIHLIGSRTRDLPACSIVPQPSTLPRTDETKFTPIRDVFTGQVARPLQFVVAQSFKICAWCDEHGQRLSVVKSKRYV
jgi:hypothetical protein